MRWRYVLLLAISILPIGVAEAHNRSQSFSSWTIDDRRLQMLYSIPAREVTRLKELEGSSLEVLLINHLKSYMKVKQDGIICPLAVNEKFQSVPSKPAFLRISAVFQCRYDLRAAPPTLVIGGFFERLSSHVHYAQVHRQGQLPLEYLFTEQRQQQALELNADGWMGSVPQALMRYTRLGIEHIFGGIDHLVFLFALLLLLPTRAAILWMVSGFTLGHSVTLSLAVLGWIVPDRAAIEALIGFSIALLCAENVAARTGDTRGVGLVITVVLGAMLVLSFGQFYPPRVSLLSLVGLLIFTRSYLPLVAEPRCAARLRPLLCVAFGLIHGFGFASGLIDIGVPADRLWSALLGFNLGVELAQLMVIAALWAIGKRLAEHLAAPQSSADFCSALLCGLGVYWFVVRSYGFTPV